MLWLLLLSLVLFSSDAVTPVVLVPGALGSGIEARLNRAKTEHFYCSKKSDWITLWLSLSDMIGPKLYCWADNFKMEFDDGVFSNTPGVETRVRGFGESSAIDYVDTSHWISYMRDLVEGLLSVPGAQRDVTVRAAPFDFRYSPPSKESSEYFSRLRALIESTYSLNSNRSVAIISHSLGSLMTSTFLHTVSQDWKDKYVHSWSSLGGVLGGSLKEVKVLVSHGVLSGPDWLTNRLLQRKVARTVMGNYFMLPRTPVWLEDEVLLQTPNLNYTLGNLDQLFRDMGLSESPGMWGAVREAPYIGDPGVRTFCFNGKNISTSHSFYYTQQSGFPDSIPEVVEGDGDGTVPHRSLKICHDWSSTEQVFEYVGDGGEHDKIMDNPQLIEQIINIIS